MKKARFMHGFIILNFVIEIIYSIFMLFVALGSRGTNPPVIWQDDSSPIPADKYIVPC